MENAARAAKAVMIAHSKFLSHQYLFLKKYSFSNIFPTYLHSYDGGKSAMRFWEDGFYTTANTPIITWTQGEPALVEWMMTAQHRGNCF